MWLACSQPSQDESQRTLSRREMLSDPDLKRGEWTLLLLREPGRPPIPGGVLLLNPTDDSLYIRLRTDIAPVDEDIALVWEELQSDLLERAAEMGGAAVMQSLEEASNTIVTGDRQQVLITHPEEILNALFATHVVPAFLRASVGPPRRFSKSELDAAGERLPISKTVGMQALKAFQERMWDFRKIAGIIERDPVLAGHLVKLANLASVSRGQDVRTFLKL